MERGSQTKLVDVEMGDRLEDMIHDLGQEPFQQAHALMYDTLKVIQRSYCIQGARSH